MTMTMMETTSSKMRNWWDTDWYKEWECLARNEGQERKIGYWRCYYNDKSELIYEYVDM